MKLEDQQQPGTRWRSLAATLWTLVGTLAGVFLGTFVAGQRFSDAVARFERLEQAQRVDHARLVEAGRAEVVAAEALQRTIIRLMETRYLGQQARSELSSLLVELSDSRKNLARSWTP